MSSINKEDGWKTLILNDICELVKQANLSRSFGNIQRRSLKLTEELGEVAQAWLNVTSPSNGKAKTYDDVREEIADCLIIALDIGWTLLPNETEVGLFFEVHHDEPRAFDPGMILRIGKFIGMFADATDAAGDTDFVLARTHITQVIRIVADMALSTLPDRTDTIGAQAKRLLDEVTRKLAKWTINRAAMAVVTDDV